MTRRRAILLAIPLLVAIVSGLAVAQFPRRGGGRGFGGRGYGGGMPGQIPADRAGVPNWKVDERFKRDVFTFVRLEYSSAWGGGRYGGWGGWATDFPDSDLNFSFRLQQLTSLKVNPDPISLRITDPKLFDYPFLYMIEPGTGGLSLSEEEVVTLRRYLLNGGFLMVDDFWGEEEYAVFYEQIKRVFPNREPEELEVSHEIFHCVYPLKEKPQVPSIHSWLGTGLTWEPRHRGDPRTVHYQAILDDDKRMMVIICYNTDLGDGWEREGESVEYFHEFSEKKSYPMGINIVTYAMTH
jgi:hypothetical protein